MRFGISIPPFAGPAEMVALAIAADANGWDGVFVWDHVHFIREARLPVHDPWVLLGAIAHATSRVRVGTLVTPLPRRRPAIVAKHIVTLDHLSGGRAVLGVGLGWPAEDEFAMFGDEPDDVIRGDRLDEALAVIMALWTGEAVRHDGTHFHVDAETRPAPLQRPRPPIWAAVMGEHARPRRRALALDGIVPLGTEGVLSPGELRTVLDAVDLLGARPPGWDVVASWADGATAEEYADAGATWLVAGRFPVGDWFDELLAIASSPPHP